MAVTDELKILGDKIKANQAQYNLDWEAAKISALSSKELDKYGYLTGEDLGYKPVVEKVKFEYSPLGEALSKGLKKIIKAIRLLNTTIIWSIILCITLTNIVCLIVTKYNQYHQKIKNFKFDTLNKFYEDFYKNRSC